MKKLIIRLSIISIMFIGAASCKKDFLEKPPGVNLDEDKVFSSKQNIELYISSAYKYVVPSHFVRQNGPWLNGPTQNIFASYGSLSGGTDESILAESWTNQDLWNSGAVDPGNIFSANDPGGAEDDTYYARWQGVRVTNILLERIDATGQPVEYKNQVKGEAYFLRALANFETFKRYGGFPIVEGRVLPSSSGTLARNTIKECVDFIVKDCNTALEILNLVPGFPTVEHTGRASKSAIKALKAKTLLFAASPLFNTGTPYLSMENPANNTLICYGNFDKERWKLAADAAKDAIATANTEGFMLLDDPAKRSPNVSDLTKPILGNYRESWEKPDNKELIMSYKGFPTTGWWEYPWLSMTPMGSYPGSWMAPPCPSQNFIKLYEKKADGMPQVWPTSGSDLNVKYRELDNRFHQTIGYNMMPYWPGTINELQNYKAGNGFGAGQHSPQCKTGYWVKKCVPNEVGAGQMIVPVISVFRYNELLLNLAEALNEYESAPTTEAYDAVNKIRIRSGMPVLAAGLTKDQFRKRVQNERSIEFAFEGHRFWDIRRWLIAETVQTGPLLGLTITRINSANTDFQYVEKTVEIRNWPKRQYLHPIQRDELTRNTGFVQNPGYLK